MICTDDLNDWLGCLSGHPNAKTPNMDSLAEQAYFSPMPIARRPYADRRAHHL